MLQGLPCGGPVLHQFVPICVRSQVTILPQNQFDRFLRIYHLSGDLNPSCIILRHYKRYCMSIMHDRIMIPAPTL
jgi:hypothetical protein